MNLVMKLDEDDDRKNIFIAWSDRLFPCNGKKNILLRISEVKDAS